MHQFPCIFWVLFQGSNNKTTTFLQTFKNKISIVFPFFHYRHITIIHTIETITTSFSCPKSELLDLWQLLMTSFFSTTTMEADRNRLQASQLSTVTLIFLQPAATLGAHTSTTESQPINLKTSHPPIFQRPPITKSCQKSYQTTLNNRRLLFFIQNITKHFNNTLLASRTPHPPPRDPAFSLFTSFKH